jgi:sensor histidine kinase regulating citrate/malate metabolism
MRVNIIARTRNSLQKSYFLQRIKLTVTTKYISCNTTHISQPFISLVAITHTYCNKIFHVAVGFMEIDQFSSSTSYVVTTSDRQHNSIGSFTGSPQDVSVLRILHLVIFHVA